MKIPLDEVRIAELKILELITSKNRYCSHKDTMEYLGFTRAYLGNLRINLTDINKSLGFVRRKLKSTNTPRISREEVILRIKSAINSRKEYLPRKVLELEYKVHSSWITFHKINVADINKELGFEIDSQMARIKNKGKLTEDIRSYINNAGQWVSQQEIVDLFKVSLPFITKNIDTVKMNYEAENKVKSFNYFEIVAYKTLQDMFGCEIELQKTFDDCRSLNSNSLLRFDFYIPDKNLLVETDGPQHTDEDHLLYTTRQVLNDATKSEYCLKKSITLVRVPWVGRKSMTGDFIRTCILEVLESQDTTTELETANVTV